MKKVNTLICMLCISVFGFSQSINIKSVERQSITGNGFFPVLNDEGTNLLYTQGNYQGLILLDLNTGEEKVISKENGTGYRPVFAADGKSIYYRRERKENGKRLKTMMSYSLVSNKEIAVSSETHQTKEFNRKMISFKSQKSSIDVTTEDLELVIYKNGKREILKPFDSVPGYIWASLSPSKEKILFTVPSKGTFVSDLTGRIISSLGYLNAPIWYNDDWILGMNDKDNGAEIISSSIVMIDSKGNNRTSLTSDTIIAMFPTSSLRNGKIAYNTINGEIYVMEIEVE